MGVTLNPSLAHTMLVQHIFAEPKGKSRVEPGTYSDQFETIDKETTTSIMNQPTKPT